MEETFRFWW